MYRSSAIDRAIYSQYCTDLIGAYFHIEQTKTFLFCCWYIKTTAIIMNTQTYIWLFAFDFIHANRYMLCASMFGDIGHRLLHNAKDGCGNICTQVIHRIAWINIYGYCIAFCP